MGNFDASLAAAGYKLHSRGWRAPAMTSGTKYLAIVYATMWKQPAVGMPVDSTTISTDRIPLRGTLTGC